jgi:perosamine synthetase
LRRTHWLFPVVVADPEALIFDLKKRGLDASQATSSIAVVEAPAEHSPPTQVRRMMSGGVFLPLYPDLPSHPLDAMVDLVNDRTVGEVVDEVTSS